MSDTEQAAKVEPCEHDWAWVSPAGTSVFARLCQICHQPDAEWLNGLYAASEDVAATAAAKAGDEKCRCARYAGPHMKENSCPQYAMGKAWPGLRRKK